GGGRPGGVARPPGTHVGKGGVRAARGAPRRRRPATDRDARHADLSFLEIDAPAFDGDLVHRDDWRVRSRGVTDRDAGELEIETVDRAGPARGAALEACGETQRDPGHVDLARRRAAPRGVED